jgi:glycosyltransferase involved in cell wall biosynthesis
MRVLFNTYPVAFDCPGGGEIQLLKCREALEAAGTRVSLFDVWQPQFGQVDLVHYFSVQGGSMNFCSHVKRRGLPLLISPILWLTDENRGRFPLAEIRDLLHIADRVLPNSQLEAQQLSDFFEVDPERFTVIPNGIDATFAESDNPNLFRSRFGLQQPFILCVANIEPRKNQHRLIHAAAKLDLDLVFIGHVRDQTYYEQCTALDYPRLHYVGHIPHRDMLLRSAYAACDVFALPSTLETPGLAALEAAAQGAPLVVTAVGSTREYFGEWARYVAPDDCDALADALQQQLTAPRSGQLRQHVLNNYMWSAAAAALNEAYRHTLSGATLCAT